MKLLLSPLRKSKLVLVALICSMTVFIFFLTRQVMPSYKLVYNTQHATEVTQPALSTAKPQLQHKTLLLSRTPCTQTFFLLILVFTAPAHFDRRKAIRRTWGTDPAMKTTWKTMFLLGQTDKKDENKYLEAETLMYNDVIRGGYKDAYRNLSLKLEMGLEWAAKYCDFQFFLKADDDVFIDTYKLIDVLQDADTPKVELYMGRYAHNWRPHRQGQYRLSVEEYNKTILPDFCTGPAYLLSRDLVLKFVELVDAKIRLPLEDVYVGLLAEKVNAKAVNQPGFYLMQFGACDYYPDLVARHHSPIGCIEKLFNIASEKRMNYTVFGLSA